LLPSFSLFSHYCQIYLRMPGVVQGTGIIARTKTVLGERM
jgi:hypothetical protein